MDFICWAFLPSGPEWLYIGIIFVLLFGAEKLPEFARGLGRTLGEFKRAKEEMEEELRRATEEDNRPRIRPRADDEDAMPRAPQTLPVGTSATAEALPAPSAESNSIAAATPGSSTEGASLAATASGTAIASAVAASNTTVAEAPVERSVTPILRPVTSAVAFGSHARNTAVESAPQPVIDDPDFDMPTAQIDEEGNPLPPFLAEPEKPASPSTAAAVAGGTPAITASPQRESEDETERRPSSFVL